MKIKHSSDGHSQIKTKPVDADQKVGNQCGGLQSRFENAMKGKKVTSKNRPTKNDIEGQTKPPCHLKDMFKQDSSHSATQRYGCALSLKTKDVEVMLEAFNDSAHSQEDVGYPSSHLATQGESIIPSMTKKASLPASKAQSKFINQLVEHIKISTPHSSPGKEVRLLLNDGQLQGGEIQIKRDNQGYQVIIRQKHAHSVINQQARQDLTERLSRVALDHPIRLLITEQSEHQHDQQHSRQQRTIYDEWRHEDNL